MSAYILVIGHYCLRDLFLILSRRAWHRSNFRECRRLVLNRYAACTPARFSYNMWSGLPSITSWCQTSAACPDRPGTCFYRSFFKLTIPNWQIRSYVFISKLDRPWSRTFEYFVFQVSNDAVRRHKLIERKVRKIVLS